MTNESIEGQRYRRREGWTERQKHVFDLLAKGRTNRQIADELGITLDGAKWHVSEILAELGVDTREEAAEWWRQQNGLRARMRVLVRAITGPAALRWIGLGAAAAAGIAAVAVVAIILAGRGPEAAGPGDEPTPDVTPTEAASTPTEATATRTAEATPTVVGVTPTPGAAEQQDGTQAALLPAPAAGAPCPVDDDICELADTVAPLLQAGDLDGLIDIAEPAPFVCPGDFFGPPPAACDGVPEGETANAFVAVSGGEGVAVDEQGLRESLQFSIDSIANADADDEDNYGSGAFQIAGVGCFRTDPAASGECDGERIDLVYTHIDPEFGAPGMQRAVTCVGVWRTDNGLLRITRNGCGVPPTTFLYEFVVEMVNNGTEGVMEWYPWRTE